MFEKEATEYATVAWDKSQDPRDVFTPRIDETKFNDWRNGAEFGYNKANEWHYVKDELPDEGTYLVIWQNDKGYKEILIMNYEEDDEEELHWVDGDYEVQDEYVIAWKELPGFPKESE